MPGVRNWAPVETVLLILLLVLVAFAVAAVIGGLRLYRSARGWVELFRGESQEVKLRALDPPQGFVFNREAKLTFEVHGEDGSTKTVEKGVQIPIPQAFLWRVAGRVPGPIGRLADGVELNRSVLRRGGK